MSNSWENSPEYEEWIESGGRDEDYSYYYNKWDRRVNRNASKARGSRFSPS